jgi:hypothetical protein
MDKPQFELRFEGLINMIYSFSITHISHHLHHVPNAFGPQEESCCLQQQVCAFFSFREVGSNGHTAHEAEH